MEGIVDASACLTQIELSQVIGSQVDLRPRNRLSSHSRGKLKSQLVIPLCSTQTHLEAFEDPSTSSTCIDLATSSFEEVTPMGIEEDLLISITMPCLEVATVGGGTCLPAQRACLSLLGLAVDRPAEHLARLIAATVLAGELSLLAALDTDDLVNAHMCLNRAQMSIVCQSSNEDYPCHSSQCYL
ncbi:unnamed protein product [Protopolystoma xenopodis]|uniref:hydroxymethylglutaryl-CoA reductase (NADPH) n=1 Tax=Protopolystoma xenopodis TaxID=117903 RepID=A0A3S5AQ40_9PLAT|nr:unnamed protein product [Protopolystoma xenopodis]